MLKIKTLEDYKTANKNYCKTYYNKKKNNLNNLKEELTALKQENNKIKQENAILIKQLTDIRDKLDTYTDTDTDTEKDTEEDTEPDEPLNYDELYNELKTRTKNFNAVFVKDFELHMKPKLKYQMLFIDDINDEKLDDKRFEWLKDMKSFLDDDDDGSDIEYESADVYIPYQYM